MNPLTSRREFGRGCCSAVLTTFAGCNTLSGIDGETSNTTKPHSTPSKPQQGKIPIYAVNHTDEKQPLFITISGDSKSVSKRVMLEAGERKRISAVSGSDQPITAETESGLKNSKPVKPGALSVTIDIQSDSIDIRSKTFSGGN